jgi:alpha-D-xyloside xylohydrolase
MLRPLSFEDPEDPTSWMIDDEYFFGSDLLVAPLFEESNRRRVYLPPGTWIDYQTGKPYEGGRWHEIDAGAVPIVVLVRNHAVVAHVAVAQSTSAIDWTHMELRVFSTDGAPSVGAVALPDGDARVVRVREGRLTADPLGGRVQWRITSGLRNR